MLHDSSNSASPGGVGHAAPGLADVLGAFTSASIEHSPITVTDAAGTILLANDAFCALSLYSRDELVGQGHQIVRSGQHPPSFFEEMWGAITSGRSWRGEIMNRAKDGSHFWVDTTIVPMVDAAGNPGRYLAFHADLGPIKELQEHLHANEERLRRERDYADAVIRSLPGIFYHYDGELRLRRWNRNLQEISGYPPEELAGTTPLQFFPPDHQALVAERIAEVFDRGASQVEADYLLHDGRRVPYVFTGVRFEHDGSRGFVGVGTNIAHLKRTEAALRDSLARFDAAVRATGDSVWDWDLATDALWWNDRFYPTYGYEPDDAGEGIDAWEKRIHPDDLDRVVRGIHATIDGAGDLWSDEYRFLRADGSYAEVFDRGYVIRDADGRGVRMVGAMQDISERKEAQAKLLAFNAELEQRVAARTRELEQVNTELESFCYSVSHDLRAPLRGIAGFAGILAGEYSDVLDETALDYLGRVQAATRRMGDLIDDLLKLSRVSRDEMSRESVDLSAIAADVVAQLRLASPDREVAVEIEPGLCADGDARLLRVALENLLGNAWKFTSATPGARIGFAGETAPSGVRTVVVSDNGAGFDMRYAGKLFSPFQRLHRESEFPGTGIGLATVQRIVHRHGGRIAAQAAPGRGATFRFTLAPEP